MSRNPVRLCQHWCSSSFRWHTLIGVINLILAFLIEVVENEIQVLPTKEIRLQREVKELESDAKELEDKKAYFESDTEGSGSLRRR